MSEAAKHGGGGDTFVKCSLWAACGLVGDMLCFQWIHPLQHLFGALQEVVVELQRSTMVKLERRQEEIKGAGRQ